MFTTARRHGITSPPSKQDQQQFHQQHQKGKKGKPVALSAPPTPSNGHAQTAAQAYAASAQARPATAVSTVPASFSRATGRSSLAHATSSGASSAFGPAAAPARPITTSSSAVAMHLPPSVPQSFPTPAPSPSPSPSPLLAAPMTLKLSMPRVSASTCATPSPLSSGLPSPTLPPLPSSHFSSQPQQGGQAHSVMPSPHVRSPVINIAPSAAGSIHGSPRIVHHHYHTRKVSLGKDEFDYRGHHVRPTHIRKYSVSSECDSVPSPRSMKPPASPNSPSDPSPSASRGSGSSMREDVLSPGDRVGVGLVLQGETLQPVFHGENIRREEPAVELEVVRRLGAGSYAIVYLVREVLHRPPPGVLDSPDKVDRRECNGEGHGDLDLWDDPLDVDLDSDPLELDGMSRNKENSLTGNADNKVYYGKEYAVKVLSKAGMDEEALEAQLVEASIHQSLPIHPNIVTLHRALETPSFLLLVLEFVPGEDLYYFLEQARDHYEPEHISSGSASSDSEGEEKGHKANTSVLSVNSVATMNTTRTPPTPSLLSTLNEKKLLGRRRLRLIASMFSQMCEAVAVCHDVGVYHRDIKPENFIVTDGWDDDGERRVVVVKLTDFGLSTRDAASSDMDCGSAPYMSYECRNNCAPTYAPRAADVWSLGIVLINMLYHINPWTDTTQGVCPSFSAFLAAPEYFFMQRFSGMVPAVASFLSQRVFCILPSEDPSDSVGRRVSAREFGRWAKDLPRMMASDEPVGIPPALSSLSAGEKSSSSFAFPVTASPKEAEKDLVSPTSPSSTLLAQSLAAVLAQQQAAAAAAGSSSPAWRHKRGLSNASLGYALSSVPQSRRPASRQQSFSAERAPSHLGLPGLGSAAGSRAATPLLRARALGSNGSIIGVSGSRSRVPSSCETPAGIIGVNELPTVFDEGEGDISIGSLGLELGGDSERLAREEEEIVEVERDREEQERLRDIDQGHERPQDLEHELEQEQEHDGEDEDTMSRSTSMVRRRKRGARRGKGQIIQQQAMEINRLQQQREELERQVQLMQDQLAKQQQSAQAQTQVQVLSSLSPITTASNLLSPKSLAPVQSLPIVPQTGASARTDDVLDSLASASEALARELSRTRNARGSTSGATSPSPTHIQTPSHANSRPLSHHAVSGSSQVQQQQSHFVSAPVSVPAPMCAISSTSLGATRDSSPARSSISASLSGSGVASSYGAGSTRGSMITTSQASPSDAVALSGAGGPTPGAMFPVSFASPGRTSSSGSATRRSQHTNSTASGKSSSVLEGAISGNAHTTAPASTAPVPAPAIAKKTSKWKLSFGKGSSNSSHSRTPLPQTQPPSEIIMDISADAERKVETKGKDKDESKSVAEDGSDARQRTELGSAQHGASVCPTTTRVKNVLMSLDADISDIGTTGAGNAHNSSSIAGSREVEPWPRGRVQQQVWNPSTPDRDRWPNVERERNVSPNSTRTGRSTGHLSTISSSTSLSSTSNNWRHSTLTTSSDSSGWTRYSNGSVRSVSTVATSVSGASGSGSWRNGNASKASLASSLDRKGGVGHYGGGSGGPPSIASRKSDKSSLNGMPPPNIKIMTGVPWALDELPRQLHPNASGDIFGGPPARKQRARKPKDLPTINERPGNGNNGPHHHHPSAFNHNKPANRSPLSQRVDATRSSTSLPRHSGDGEEMMRGEGGEDRDGSRERTEGAPRKVQKGQINALAKMLSALRR